MRFCVFDLPEGWYGKDLETLIWSDFVHYIPWCGRRFIEYFVAIVCILVIWRSTFWADYAMFRYISEYKQISFPLAFILQVEIRPGNSRGRS
jgi:hypothetical protein